MRKNGFARHALIETLHTVQSSFGYLDDDAIRFVARRCACRSARPMAW
jgi:bidirectional [NiFe] hydrogenase diaphorase subunit